jgi:outer membrane lipoprotein LolB
MRGLILVLLLALSACASVPHGQSAASLLQREITPFNLNGRLSVRHLDQRYTGGLRWQHQMQRDELLLQGPLGITAARIVSDAHSATLEQSGKRYQADDVEILMQQVLGWGLPLPVLHHWLLGSADAASPAEIERDEQGRIAVLRQAGWEVRYLRYADDRSDSLPARIALSRENLQVQLLIDEWEWQ